ncbi:hypothetical protein ACE1B6_24450 [Aerosakkonemataceae cyanobacterium BLCC-F154]|uniref:Uncharacterized protein n=1 Tax=Floridaenema fluviatile BLCC-F154 TaxID=3153640 RepID=A0ABV4YHV3_9CYAN
MRYDAMVFTQLNHVISNNSFKTSYLCLQKALKDYKQAGYTLFIGKLTTTKAALYQEVIRVLADYSAHRKIIKTLLDVLPDVTEETYTEWQERINKVEQSYLDRERKEAELRQGRRYTWEDRITYEWRDLRNKGISQEQTYNILKEKYYPELLGDDDNPLNALKCISYLYMGNQVA